jgi:predicted nucleotidyltransferase
MTCDEAIEILSSNADELRRRGVRSLSLFGSVVHGDARPDSDVDVLLDLAADHQLSLVELIGLQHFISDILHAPADVAIRSGLKPALREEIISTAVRVF